jgi:hypothetical protein
MRGKEIVMLMKFLTAGAGLAAMAAAPAAAQYYQPYGNAYGYYGNNNYNNANFRQMAANQCSAAVQARLNNRTSLAEVIGSLVGANTAGRVLSVSSIDPNRRTIRVRGYATSGRYASSPYGYGYYGSQAYGYANQTADISFKCDVDYQGRVRDVDLNRRR